MYQSINFSQFCDAFKGDVGSDRSTQFSYEGKRALFDYLEEIENSTQYKENNPGIELDVIAICCDFTEYDSLEDLQKNYNNITSLEDLQDHTTVIECDNGHLIIQNF